MKKCAIPLLCWLAMVVLVVIAWTALWGARHSYLADLTAALAGLLGWKAGAAFRDRGAKE